MGGTGAVGTDFLFSSICRDCALLLNVPWSPDLFCACPRLADAWADEVISTGGEEFQRLLLRLLEQKDVVHRYSFVFRSASQLLGQSVSLSFSIHSMARRGLLSSSVFSLVSEATCLPQLATTMMGGVCVRCRGSWHSLLVPNGNGSHASPVCVSLSTFLFQRRFVRYLIFHC